MSGMPVCNYCKYEFNDDETWYNQDLGKEDGDTSKLVCPNCGKTIYIMCEHKIDFITVDENYDEFDI